MAYKAMYKNELARAAGVSNDTFRRWLISDRAVFEAMGISPTQRHTPEAAEAALNGEGDE